MPVHKCQMLWSLVYNLFSFPWYYTLKTQLLFGLQMSKIKLYEIYTNEGHVNSVKYCFCKTSASISSPMEAVAIASEFSRPLSVPTLLTFKLL